MPAPNTPPGTAQDDDLVFADEMPAVAPHGGSGTWRVLIVDDDADVHSTTTFALGALEMHGRPLEFRHAYSAGEAMALLEKNPPPEPKRPEFPNYQRPARPATTSPSAGGGR